MSEDELPKLCRCHETASTLEGNYHAECCLVRPWLLYIADLEKQVSEKDRLLKACYTYGLPDNDVNSLRNEVRDNLRDSK